MIVLVTLYTVHIRVYVHTYICMCVCTYVRMYVCIYVCMYIRRYVLLCVTSTGYPVGGLQPNEEVPRMWLCCGEERWLQQNELYSLWDVLLLALWSKDWRVRG